MEAKNLVWSPSKTFMHNGETLKINVVVRLHDGCKNGHYDFSITGSVYRKARNGKWVYDEGGCIHEAIALSYPELKKFIPLHLCNYLGHPMYPEANGQYFIRERGKEVAMQELRITEDEYEQLAVASDNADRPYFKYLLFDLGIVDRWKREADEFIAFLEEKTGSTWVNPYKPEEERNIMKLTDEERADTERKMAGGYYTQEAIESRKVERHKAKQEAKRNEVVQRYEEATRKVREERDVMLYLFDNGMPIDNVIYYDHTKKVVFNWIDCRSKITKEQFDKFVSNVDYLKLPDGVTFHLGKEK